MRTAKTENIVFLAGRTRTSSNSDERGEFADMAKGQAQLMRLYDRFKGPVGALGARLDPSMVDPEILDKTAEN